MFCVKLRAKASKSNSTIRKEPDKAGLRLESLRNNPYCDKLSFAKVKYFFVFAKLIYKV
jgi:hypothetical protein